LGKKLLLNTLRIEDDKGFALASGSMDLRSQKLDINVEADELDVGPIVQAVRKQLGGAGTKPPLRTETAAIGGGGATSTPFNLDALQGVGYVRAHVGGSLRQPEVQGKVSAFTLTAGKVGVDRVMADFDMTRDAVRIASGTAERYPGELTFSG